jgi:hypothetical protein
MSQDDARGSVQDVANHLRLVSPRVAGTEVHTMTLDEYFDEWKKDAPLVKDDLDTEAREVPNLHAKWLRFHTTERLRYRKLELDYKTLYNHKFQWYSGKMIDEDRLKLGWPPNPVKLMPTAIPRHIDADPDIQTNIKGKILAEETCRFLEEVVSQINKRGFHISNAINFLKWKMGV